MSFHQKHGTLPAGGSLEKFFYDYKYFYRIQPDSKFMIRANGQFSDASIVPSFLKNQIFEFQASGEYLEKFTFTFTGHHATLGLANADVRTFSFL